MNDVRFHITVKAIIAHEDKILILKKVLPSTDGLGYWELPGGGLEYNETPQEALQREVKEETSLDIEVGDPLYTFTNVRDDYQSVGIAFLAHPLHNTVHLSFEHVDYHFATKDELSQFLSGPIYNEVIQAIEKYHII